MPQAEWGADPDFFGPRHAHREGRILRALARCRPAAGPHLECAAGVGSLSLTLLAAARPVVAADRSLRSLAVLRRRSRGAVPAVVADITRLPFADGAFTSASSAETLEHIPDDGAAARELARVLAPGGCLVGTVPAGPEQWSAWDEWAGHERRYTAAGLHRVLADAGLAGEVTAWGFPLLRLYDGFFLRRVNRRRLETSDGVEHDPALRTVAGLGRRRWLVRLVRATFALDRLFDGSRWGVGLLFRVSKPATPPRRPATSS